MMRKEISQGKKKQMEVRGNNLITEMECFVRLCRFTGKYEDEEIGLYYNRFRYYDFETGQYDRQDPIGLAGGLNLYSYVKNSSCQFDILGREDIVYRALYLRIRLPIDHVLYYMGIKRKKNVYKYINRYN